MDQVNQDFIDELDLKIADLHQEREYAHDDYILCLDVDDFRSAYKFIKKLKKITKRLEVLHFSRLALTDNDLT